MDILNDIKGKLRTLNEEEAALLARQRETEAKLAEVWIKLSVYEELLGKYAQTVTDTTGRIAYRGASVMEHEPRYTTASFETRQAQAQGYPQPAAPAYAPPSYVQPEYAPQQAAHTPPQQPAYTAAPPQPAYAAPQPDYAPPQPAYAPEASRPPAPAAQRRPAPARQARPRRQSAPDQSNGARRMSSQTTAEIWMTVCEILADGSSWQVGDLRHELEERMDIGEINRTTLQSILKRNEAELDRGDKGYVRLYAAR